MGAALTLVHFRVVSYPLSVDRPVGTSPIETDGFVQRVRAVCAANVGGIELRVRVYLCRHEHRAMPMAFKRGSIVVIGGRDRRWPTSEARLRRRLEAAGHFVVFVNPKA